MLQQCKRRLKLVGLLNEARKTSFGIFLRSKSFPQFLFSLSLSLSLSIYLSVLTLIKYFFTETLGDSGSRDGIFVLIRDCC